MSFSELLDAHRFSVNEETSSGTSNSMITPNVTPASVFALLPSGWLGILVAVVSVVIALCILIMTAVLMYCLCKYWLVG